MEVLSRICTKCGRELPLECFNKCCTGKYGRRAMCRECEHKMQNTPGEEQDEENWKNKGERILSM